MNYPNYDPQEHVEAGRQLVALSEWIDNHPPNKARSPEAQLWGRVSKIGEEFGEVIAEMILATGQNPRKPQDETAGARLDKELLDVALTALNAWEHRHGNSGGAIPALFGHIQFVHDRMLG